MDPVDLTAPVFAACRRRLEGRFGASTVAPWWRGLASEIDGAREAWQLDIGEPMGHGETALVLRCVQADRSAAFLKLTPDPQLSIAEAAALDHWATTGRVPLVLERAPRRGVLLLEALATDVPLSRSGGRPSLEAIATLAAALQDVPPVDGAFPPLGSRVDFLFDRWERHLAEDPSLAATVDGGRLAAGRRLATGLAASAPVPLLVHGDLHPGNVFDVGGAVGLMTLDPRPCVGDPGFDLIDWVLWQSDDPQTWQARAGRLAALTGSDAVRTWAWCEAFAAFVAALELARGATPERVAALLSVAPDS